MNICEHSHAENNLAPSHESCHPQLASLHKMFSRLSFLIRNDWLVAVNLFCLLAAWFLLIYTTSMMHFIIWHIWKRSFGAIAGQLTDDILSDNSRPHIAMHCLSTTLHISAPPSAWLKWLLSELHCAKTVSMPDRPSTAPAGNLKSTLYFYPDIHHKRTRPSNCGVLKDLK